ncbi:efflux RND transporter periplasmic adaptor subunit [Wohlfahrtiimonas larvae]|uniref:HlyD family secretion protein n=2 Tax=Wohlfahrtiimonas larvae TaxID=1157986 RepID=A0ABP9MLD1_9GAMM|nr:HlyD family secretion protein [Wohlfahrtiimonas larvae]
MKAFFQKYTITFITVLFAILFIKILWNYYMLSPWTRDARIRADVITITSDVSGYVTELLVKDNQHVNQGDILLKINADRYHAALDKAKAQLAIKTEQLKLKEHEATRRTLLDGHAISEELKENAKIEVNIAKAELKEAQANVQQAQIDLERSIIKAPKSGVISNLRLTEGNYVRLGESIVAVIVDNSLYVQAYLEETKLAKVSVGMPVHIKLMSGDHPLEGHIESISYGITDQSSTTDDQLLANVTPTYNWVRLAQRIPVRIKINEIPKDIHIATGMTASVRIGDTNFKTLITF